MRVFRPLFFFIYGLLPLIMLAQRLEVEAPSRASTDDYFTLRYTVSSSAVGDFTSPAFKGVTLLSGPNVSTSSSYTSINGKASSSESTTFTFLLQPTTKGRLTIPPASVVVNGKKVSSRAITIEVTDGGGKGNGQSAPSQSVHPQAPQMQSAGTPISKSDVFVKLVPSRTKVLEQEAVFLSYKICVRPNVALDNVGLSQKPEFRNLVSHNLPTKPIAWERERIGGKDYQVGTIAEFLVFPQKKGQIVIPPIVFNCVVLQQENGLSALEAFFNGGGMSAVTVQRQPESLTLQVDALPEPKPNAFSGGVGKFTVKGELLTPNLRTNEVATYRLTVSGVGNLKLIAAPAFNIPKDFELFEPKSEEKTTITASGEEGTMTFDYQFIPRNVGRYTVDAPTFVFFDPTTKRYETLTLDKLTLVVAKGSDTRPTVITDLQPLAQGRRTTSWLQWGGVTFWVLHLCILGIGVAVIIYLRRRWGLDTDLVSFVQRRANAQAKHRLRKAESHLSKGEQPAFYAEIAQALHSYVADKFHVPPAEITKERIAELLAPTAIPAGDQADFIRLLEDCEFAQFAPSAQLQSPREMLQRAEQLIVSINKVLSK